jgi:regulator of protease activity HflC (stomatin/prohibitin superfamily)
VDVHAKLDELTAMIDGARAMPMSASCIINRTEALERLEELRKLLPGELTTAQQILDERGAVVAEGRAEAERIIEAARGERAKLVARTEVVRDASREAEAVLSAARADAERMRVEIDDYVDGKLANFEVVLQKTLQAVEKGRAKISGRHELDALAGPVDDLALPE